MNKIILAGLIAFTLISCRKTQNELAEKFIKAYIILNTDNPKSYEAISFGELSRKTEYDSITIFTMKHSFRLKNEKGISVLDSALFCMDKNLKIITSLEILEDQYEDYSQSIDSSSIVNDISEDTTKFYKKVN